MADSANYGIMLETVPPAEMGAALAADAAKKAKFGTIHLLIRGFLCTPFLAYGASVVFAMVAAGIPLAAAGLVFPVGYVTLSFLGLEMATGSFVTMPVGMFAGTITPGQLVRNWVWTLAGNLLGGIFFGWLLWFSLHQGRIRQTRRPAYRRRPHRRAQGRLCSVRRPWMVRRRWHGHLCNWLVSLGSVMSKATRSTVGRILLMWIPIGTFFALGFEHTVVNMWLFPTRHPLGCQRELLRLVGVESDPGHHRQYPGCDGAKWHPLVLHPYAAEGIVRLTSIVETRHDAFCVDL